MAKRATQAHQAADALDALIAPGGAHALADLAAQLLSVAPPVNLAAPGSALASASAPALPSAKRDLGKAAAGVRPVVADRGGLGVPGAALQDPAAGAQPDLFADLAIRAELDAMAQASSVRHLHVQRFWIELMFDLVGYRVDEPEGPHLGAGAGGVVAGEAAGSVYPSVVAAKADDPGPDRGEALSQQARAQRAGLALMQRRLLVPSFGSGDWMIVAVRRLLQAWRLAGCPAPFGGTARRVGRALPAGCLADALRAVEMHRASFEASSERLMALLHTEGFDPVTAQALIDQWLVYGDYLDLPLPQTGFQLIVGQFPDARQMPVAPALMQSYQQRFRVLAPGPDSLAAIAARGGAEPVDLSPAFVERSLGLLTRGGHLACIMPGAWLTADASQPLRDALAAQWHLKLGLDLSQAQAFVGEGFEQPVGLVFSRWPGRVTQLVGWRPLEGRSGAGGRRRRGGGGSPGAAIERLIAADAVVRGPALGAGRKPLAQPVQRLGAEVGGRQSQPFRSAASQDMSQRLSAGLAQSLLAVSVGCVQGSTDVCWQVHGRDADAGDPPDRVEQAALTVPQGEDAPPMAWHVSMGWREVTLPGQPWWIQLSEQSRLAARLRLVGVPIRQAGCKILTRQVLNDVRSGLAIGGVAGGSLSGAMAGAIGGVGHVVASPDEAFAGIALAVLRSTSWPADALQTLLRAGWMQVFAQDQRALPHHTDLLIVPGVDAMPAPQPEDVTMLARRPNKGADLQPLIQALRRMYLPSWDGLSEAQRAALRASAERPAPQCVGVVIEALGIEAHWARSFEPGDWQVCELATCDLKKAADDPGGSLAQVSDAVMTEPGGVAKPQEVMAEAVTPLGRPLGCALQGVLSDEAWLGPIQPLERTADHARRRRLAQQPGGYQRPAPFLGGKAGQQACATQPRMLLLIAPASLAKARSEFDKSQPGTASGAATSESPA